MELVRMIRPDGAIADVRPDWVAEWQALGWTVESAAGGADLDLTREGIAAMGKAELLELLEAHGWNGDKRLGVEKLRQILTEIVFIEA
jgi:hypothetical protein